VYFWSEDSWERLGRLEDIQNTEVEWTLTPKQWELRILLVSIITALFIYSFIYLTVLDIIQLLEDHWF
jgi:hypothetical protein